MLCEVLLTKGQQDFAAERYGLIYKFLNDNHLPENEFYDVAIFPYLRAVQDYCNSAFAQKCSSNAIAVRQMRFRLCDCLRTQARRKHSTEVISIYPSLYSDGVPLGEVLPGQDRPIQEFEIQQMPCDLTSHISEQQMKIVRMKGYGYDIKKISNHEEISMRRIQELLEEVRTAFLRLYREQPPIYHKQDEGRSMRRNQKNLL